MTAHRVIRVVGVRKFGRPWSAVWPFIVLALAVGAIVVAAFLLDH